MVCLVLAGGEQWMRMFYCFVLPVAGITLQNIMQKRSDNFTQGLMDKLLQERNTLNDLSMLDPLTGLYNRRGLQNRMDNIRQWIPANISSCFWILTISKPTTITMAI